MTPWRVPGFQSDCRIMAYAVFGAGLLSWYTWKANIHIADVWLPFVTLDVDIIVLEQRPLVLGDMVVNLWLVGILLVIGGVWLWKKCVEWEGGDARRSVAPTTREG